MSGPCIGFVGGGRIAKILLAGWTRAHALPSKVVVSDIDAGALDRLKRGHANIETVGGENAKAAAQDVVFIALHPPAIAPALATIRPAMKPDSLLVSLAPKFTIAKLSELLGGLACIARVIPNAASIVGAGVNPVVFGAAVTAPHRAALKGLLQPLGKCPEVPEALLEAYAIVTAMGPTYFWPQLYELQSLAVEFGPTPSAAAEAVRDMIAGAVATMAASGLSAEEVQDLIPVKPLADLQPALVDGYRVKLKALLEKIRS